MTSWYNNTHPYRKKISIYGKNISGNHSNFPFLFYISSTADVDIQRYAHSGGKDFIFTQSDGITRTHCEIENWNNGSGAVWVRVPSLTNRTSGALYLYYGAKTDNTNDAGYKPSGVWNSNFRGVWHMNNTPAGLNSIIDSTAFGNHGSSQNSMNSTDSVKGMVGKAINFNRIGWSPATGGGDYIKVSGGAHYSSLSVSGNLSITSWAYVKPMSLDYGYYYLLEKNGGVLDNKDNYSLFFYRTSSMYCEWTGDSGYTIVNSKTMTSPNNPAGSWKYYGCIWDKSVNKVRYSINGVEFDTDTNTNNIRSWVSGALYIGCQGDPSYPVDYFFDGMLDEIRIEKVARTTGWIKTTYSSMKNPMGFYSLGGSETKFSVSGDGKLCFYGGNRELIFSTVRNY